jgi:hypothetical protein
VRALCAIGEPVQVPSLFIAILDLDAKRHMIARECVYMAR